MKLNNNLKVAKKKKDDEFYTKLSDIENEVKYYKKHFIDKVVYCNCDDPEWSNFFIYFKDNFHHLQLKKLISTHYTKDIMSDKGYKLECVEIINSGGELQQTKTFLTGDGDFRSDECIELLKESDIVCTNPPFSLFREYVAQLMEYKKDFLIIGSENSATYKDVFQYFKNDEVWFGFNHVKEFTTPKKEIKKFGNICWYTNLAHTKRTQKLAIWKKYNKNDYVTYDNYSAINVNNVNDIPSDYNGLMGVPITFLNKYNPNQFEIMGIDRVLTLALTGKVSRFRIDGKEIYARVIIKNKTI